MAIYHLSTKPISRSSGRSAVASIAYRAGIKITDERLGKTYDYSKRYGVLHTDLITPNRMEIDRSKLWNLAEKTEKRSNSRTAREIIINIPHELMQGDQSAGKMLAYEFATNLSQKYQIAVDIAIHAPDKQGDNRNYHAHLLLTTRQIEQQDSRFKLGKKSQLEMSNTQLKQAGLPSNQDELKQIRKTWADFANKYLEKYNINQRIDHRSHKDRGLLTLPTIKMGWKATELERKGIKTEVGNYNRNIQAHNAEIEKIQALKEKQKFIKTTQKPPKKEQTETTMAKSHQNALETSTDDQDTKLPTNILEWLKTQNRAILDTNQKTAILNQYNQQLNQLAEQIYNQQKQTLIQQSKPLWEQIEQQKIKEPLFFGKNKWQSNLDQTIKEYNQIKEQFDTLKQTGITDHHKQQAYEQLKQQYPKEIEYLQNIKTQPDINTITLSQSLDNLSKYSLNHQDILAIQIWKTFLETKYKNHPKLIHQKLKELNEKIPDIANGKIQLPKVPDNSPNIEIKTANQKNQKDKNHSR